MTLRATMDSIGEVDGLRELFATHANIEVLGESPNPGIAEVRITAETLPELIELAAIVCGCQLPAGDDLLVEPDGGDSYWVEW